MNWYSYEASLKDALRTINVSSLEALATTLHKAREMGATVFTCGNGGSASAASHLAQDLSKGTRIDSQPSILRTHCLCDNVSTLTAWANDDGYEWVFFQQVVALGRPNDVLIAISGSGNSPNVLHAVEAAHAKQMRTWGIVGFDGGELINLAHRSVHVLCGDMGMVEAAHGIIFHWLVSHLLEKARGSDDSNCVKAWAPA